MITEELKGRVSAMLEIRDNLSREICADDACNRIWADHEVAVLNEAVRAIESAVNAIQVVIETREIDEQMALLESLEELHGESRAMRLLQLYTCPPEAYDYGYHTEIMMGVYDDDGEESTESNPFN
jgi:sugar-specific transcriptional regulator TrmB